MISTEKIDLIVYDFDGVMTDNKVILREDGLESVVVNRADGLAIGMIKEWGMHQIILSTETNKVVQSRASKLDIPVITGVQNKKDVLVSYCEENNISLVNVVYIGNDLNDLEIMKVVGYPVCPSDACEEIRAISKIILNIAGGEGVVRELIKHFEVEE